MHPAATTTAADARRSRRVAEVAEQRRSGNGTVADVAAFCRVSERTVINWKETNTIGHTQIGGNIWFSADDVADLAAGHRLGKYSTVSPTEIPDRVRKEWREFLGGVDHNQTVLAELATFRAVFQRFFPDALEAVGSTKSSPLCGGPLDAVHATAVSVISTHKKAA